MDHINQEDGSHFALPTPTDTSYGSPPRSLSRNSHKRRSSSPNISPPPAPFPPNGDSSPQRGPDAINSATDESISPLDPRRFTPSLHASLVSEILSLRRDVESKTKDIEHLEASLDASRSENESLQETIASTSKEARSMRSQIQLLEGGTVSALSELSKERDEALNDSADLRRRLEQSQKRARSQEESAEKIQMLWDHDRGTWEKEKRALETKVHIVEGRLKVVLSEIANCHMVNGQLQDVNPHESPKKKHLKKGSVASVRSFGSTGRRRDSEVSLGTQEGDFHGYRLSTMTIPNGVSTSLADELAFDEDEEYQMDQNERPEEQGSADELPEERPMSVQSRPFDSKARKVLGLAPEDQLQSLAETEQQRQSIGPNVRESLLKKIQALYEVQYVDAAVQCSPPASPKLIPRADSPQTIANDDKTIYYSDALSHQDPETPLQLTHSEESPFATPKAECPMISTSCQTSIQLPSPPGTPTGQQVPVDRNLPAEMNSTATQTDIFNEVYDTDAMKVAASFVQNLPIPTIAIHPPASRPGTPTGNVVLPPCTKNATCQVNFEEVAGYASSSMQTEEIRVDARATQLPQALVPQRKSHQQTESGLIGRTSALQPANPLPNSSKRRLQPSGSTKQLSRKKGLEHAGERLIQSPTNENEGPAQTSRSENLSRALESRASSRGVEDAIIEDSDEPEWKGFDEDDIFSRPTAKFTLRAGKLVAKDQAETNYQDIFERIDAEADEPEVSSMDGGCMELPRSKTSRRDVQGNGHISRPLERKPRASRSTMSKQADIRKAALISSGTAAHQSAQDDSSGAPIQPPPFPVPTRHSSRKPPVSLSEGAQSPTPGSRSPRKRDGKSRKAGPRKARSANSVDREPIPSRQRSPTPTRISSPYDSTKNPSVDLPPMPFVDPGAPQGLDFAASTSSRGPSRQYSHSRTNSASTVLQSTSVVDAIAQTMVGEWMFKYVRRRKSFGVSEPKATDWDLMRNGELSANITNTGVRHKRWVWLAPYERAVMWSSKQPTSGSALMGKSGRKLEIQSVLDVRDDNPLPKGAGPGPHFNRSILILTPQRALKFTATSQGRHYLWLTALSFLSHSPLGLGDLTALPPVPQQEYLAPPGPVGSLRRNPIRDSIRVAKGREGRFGRGGAQRSFTSDGVMPSYHTDHEPIHETISDAADPPTVPRYHSHTRQRSNTGPRHPPPSFRKLSSNHNPPSIAPTPSVTTYSMSTTTASDIYHPPSVYSGHHPGSTVSATATADFHSAKSSFSRRGSEASTSVANSGAGSGGHIDPYAPTRRMEAFIGEEGEQRPRASYRTRQGRKKDMGYWGVGAERGVVSPPPMPGLDLQEEMVASGNNYYPRPGSRSPIAMQASGGYDLPPHQYQRDDAEMCNNDFEPSRSHYGLRVDSLGFDNGQAGVGVGVNHFRGF